MDSVAIGKPFMDLSELCYKSKAPLLVKGPHGVGKSVILEQMAKNLNINIIVRDLSLMEPTDLVGLPVIESLKTYYATPSFLPTGGRGILVLEELNRCERFMRNPCLQLCTARAFNDYVLPPEWSIVATINPSGGEYDVDVLDPALLSRFVQVEVFAHVEEWLTWAICNGIHPSVIRYIRNTRNVLCNGEANPRGWASVSKFLQLADDKSLSMAVKSAIRGTIGDVHGTAFIKTLSDHAAPIDAQCLLNRYGLERSQVLGWLGTGRLDLVNETIHAVEIYLQDTQNFRQVRESDNRWNNLTRFVSDLPGDLQAEFRKYFEGHGYEFPKARQRAPRKAR